MGIIGLDRAAWMGPATVTWRRGGVQGLYYYGEMPTGTLSNRLQKTMNRLQRTALFLFAALLCARGAHAQASASLDSVRIEAKDTIALAKFYHDAFGMQEVNRIQNGAATEVFVNFGATVEAAKANKNPTMILFHRESDDVKDPTTHVIFQVQD